VIQVVVDRVADQNHFFVRNIHLPVTRKVIAVLLQHGSAIAAALDPWVSRKHAEARKCKDNPAG